MSGDVTEPEPPYGLVMPFVVCKTNGGPWDDSAFVAGARFGQIQQECKTITAGRYKEWWVEPELVRQLDLLAMNEGLVMETEPWDEHPDEWAHVLFRRPAHSAQHRAGSGS